jgi:hypothetical protein
MTYWSRRDVERGHFQTLKSWKTEGRSLQFDKKKKSMREVRKMREGSGGLEENSTKGH